MEREHVGPPAKIEVNRKNARRSTGPITPEENERSACPAPDAKGISPMTRREEAYED
jgi:hypothetical protein